MRRHVIRRLTRLDTLFLLLLLVGFLLVGARYRTAVNPPPGGGDARAEITVTLRADSEAQMQTIRAADEVLTQKGDTVIGTLIESPTVTPAKIEVTRRDGTVVLHDSGTAHEIRMTLASFGSLSENGFFLADGTHLTANQSLPVQINGLNVTILVLKIDVFSSF